MKKRFFIYSCIILLCNLNVSAQTYIVDLSKNVKGKTMVIKPDQTFDIKIENMILVPSGADAVYKINIEKKFHTPEAFETKEFSGMDDTEMAPLGRVSTICDNVMKAIKKLKESNSEGTVKKSKKTLKKAIKKAGTNCTELVDEANDLIEGTTLTLPDNLLSKGEYLELIISRKEGDEDITWVFTFDPGEKGQWITSYGFSFATHAFSNEGAYFLRQEETIDMDGNKTNQFRITEEKDRKYMNFIPSVMFSYLFNNNKSLKWSFTGGLGVDTDKPTVFLGLSAFYHYNLGVSVGLVAHPQKQLRGQYKDEEDKLLLELIETDQLHNEPYRINPFFSVSFRFADNPFNKKE